MAYFGEVGGEAVVSLVDDAIFQVRDLRLISHDATSDLDILIKGPSQLTKKNGWEPMR